MPQNDLDSLDFEMSPGAVLAQLGGLAGHVAWYSEQYKYLGHKFWPSVLGWNLALACVLHNAKHKAKVFGDYDYAGTL